MTHYVTDVYVITSLLHIITVVIFACYCMLIQNLLLHCYYILLHCYYMLLHQSLLPVITNSLLLIITSLLRYYYVIITSLCNLQNSCNNGFIITYSCMFLLKLSIFLQISVQISAHKMHILHICAYLCIFYCKCHSLPECSEQPPGPGEGAKL